MGSLPPYPSAPHPRQINNQANITPLNFLQAGCPSCCPTNSVKALKDKALSTDCWSICLCYLHLAPVNPEDGEMYLLVPVHPGCPSGTLSQTLDLENLVPWKIRLIKLTPMWHDNFPYLHWHILEITQQNKTKRSADAEGLYNVPEICNREMNFEDTQGHRNCCC